MIIHTSLNLGLTFFVKRSLVSTAVLAYTLGLRHAFDADHISVWVSSCPLGDKSLY